MISDLYFSIEKDYGIIFITNGGEWGYGDYSGWYNIEEEIFNACLDELENLTVGDINNYKNNFEFVLEQNYPNPFNPSTNIEYSVPKVGTIHELSLHVTLRVYDILGNEVAELVNEVKDAGKYKINFDASALSSGIYFYQLQAGSIIQTKKLILLK
ncbi:MAG: T9SS type A sorting domain-containing protein [Melioribacteraceae bacterium]|nr:T9SS type A sorting domain-containing protein [Melioribacteraceae bacterium]